MTKDTLESESEGDSDLADEEIEDQNGGNGSTVDMEGNDWPKNQGKGELRYCFILRNFSPFMSSV